MPGVEGQWGWDVEVVGEIGAEPAERLAVGGFVGGEVEAAGRLAQRPQEEGLALASAAGHDTERGSGAGIGGEIGEGSPLGLPVEHVVRPVQHLHRNDLPDSLFHRIRPMITTPMTDPALVAVRAVQRPSELRAVRRLRRGLTSDPPAGTTSAVRCLTVVRLQV